MGFLLQESRGLGLFVGRMGQAQSGRFFQGLSIRNPPL